MEDLTPKLLLKIVKGLGLTLAAITGIGGAIAYYNYKIQKDHVDDIHSKFI